eukprot:CAMPEP_0184861408 /NCGR_PEP_ID=MMETSP0580-20130426/6097_1 /TAXON_ID=1118495 /ORGANISM="Dactyliosolen fragilissimus" /LENGTH=1196 /DNA_ID=CAMNT_0027358895 /DNA_START=11 /DNA_END=3599 /DNA_ORIENTATION=+
MALGIDKNRIGDSSTSSSTSSSISNSVVNLAHHGVAASSYPHSITWLANHRSTSTSTNGSGCEDVDDTSRTGDGISTTGTSSTGNEEKEHAFEIAYASHSSINLARNISSTTNSTATAAEGLCMDVAETLRSNLTNASDGIDPNDVVSGERSITCMVRIPTCRNDTTPTVHKNQNLLKEEAVMTRERLASAFTDGTVTLWTQQYSTKKIHSPEQTHQWKEDVIVLPSDYISICNQNQNNQNINSNHLCKDTPISPPTDLCGIQFIDPSHIPNDNDIDSDSDDCDNHDDENNTLKNNSLTVSTLIITASSNGIISHLRTQTYPNTHYNTSTQLPIACTSTTNTSSSSTSHQPVASYPAASVQILPLPYHSNPTQHTVLLASGTASPRFNKIHIHLLAIPHNHCRQPNANIHTHTHTQTQPLLQIEHQGYLSGHLDWITCLAFQPILPSPHSNQNHSQNNQKHTNHHHTQEYLLASGSQDANIRLWRFHTPITVQNNDMENPNEIHTNYHDNDNNNENHKDDQDELEEGEARMHIHPFNTNIAIPITLEALLIGHEEPVTGISWRPPSSPSIQSFPNFTPSIIPPVQEQNATLASSGMDRTILIWKCCSSHTTNHHNTNNHIQQDEEEDIWVPITRVGCAGGILGGSIGSYLLGFVDIQFSPDGNHLMAHGYGGSLHFWSSSFSDSSLETWKAGPCITGHFGPVTDLSWEASSGKYLLTVGSDQTCRLWSPISITTHSSFKVIWKEVGRPQVHGYDMMAVCSIGYSQSREQSHRFVSGADETEIRVFDAPTDTLHLLKDICSYGTHLDGHPNETDQQNEENQHEHDMGTRVQRAYIPSLGLSNRATASDAMEEGTEHGKEFSPQNTFNYDNNSSQPEDVETVTSSLPSVKQSWRRLMERLPRERDLGVASLWPETRKLYGHGTELACMVSTCGIRYDDDDDDDGLYEKSRSVIVASSCKARNPKDASIRLWNVNKSTCLQVLEGGHKSTVTTMSFSDDGLYLASSGRDRRLCIWRQQHRDNDSDNDISTYSLVTAIDNAHKRIIWGVDFIRIANTTRGIAKGRAEYSKKEITNNTSGTYKNIMATGSRDGFVKIWCLKDFGGEEDLSIELKEVCRFVPNCADDNKNVAVTALAFAPNVLPTGFLVAIGTECGLIEVWHISKSVFDDNVKCDGTDNLCQIFVNISVEDCHVGPVKKLAW